MTNNFLFKLLLMPLSLLYGFGIMARNLMYDTGVIKSSKFSLPLISIGNLSMGGAGKTPHLEYLIRLLNPYLEIGTLSRGYNRLSKGYKLVNRQQDNALSVGDEPMMYAVKYADVTVAVSENRALAVPQMVMSQPKLQAVLLDDAYQHRSVSPYINILLTQHERPFTSDFILPSGRLREWPSSYRRADIIIVTKCPTDLSLDDKKRMIENINPSIHQEIFFSEYDYGPLYSIYQPNHQINLNSELDAIIISAIANTDYMMKYLDPKLASYTLMQYEDHHNFTEADVNYIIKVFKERDTVKKFVLTTEKDAMRLNMHRQKFYEAGIPIYILPVRVRFLFDEGPAFDESIRQRLLSFEN